MILSGEVGLGAIIAGFLANRIDSGVFG